MARAPSLIVSLLMCAACAASPEPVESHGGAALPPEARTVRIGVIGDQTGTDDLDAAYVWLERGVDALNGRDLDLVLHVGDLIESALPEDQVRADFARAAGLLGRLDAPWMLTPGDHDINPPERIANATDRSREALFLELLKGKDDSLGETFHRTRQVGDWRIILLNSHDHLHADPRWGVTYLARLSDNQITWLREELQAPQPAVGTIVLIHQPLWYNWAGWSEVHALLAEAGVSLVLSGHTHYPQMDIPIDGITYMTVGATGGSTKHGSASAGDVHHVTELVLSPGNVDVTLIALDETGRAGTFPINPRSAMDRVQAVDVMLGASRFQAGPDQNDPPETCPEGRYLALPNLGNPIDLPLRVEILAPDAAVSHHFREGACTPGGDGACLVPPGYGIVFSNNSSVALRPEADPFFEAFLPESARDEVFRDLTVRATFDHAGQSYRLERVVPVSVSCS